MSLLKTVFCLFVFLLSFLPTAQSMDEEDPNLRYLSRHIIETDYDETNDEWEKTTLESCRYYPTASRISFKGDEVYSQEYDLLDGEIKNHVQFLSQSTPCYEKVNFLTVILSATGSKNGRIQRKWRNLYVREANGIPTLQTSRPQEQDKILVFCSEQFSKFPDYKGPKPRFLTFKNIKGVSLSNFKRNYQHSHKFDEHSNSCENIYDLFRSSSFPPASPVRIKLEEKYKGESHTEPLCLSAIQTLPNDTFVRLLPEGYTLNYYEIHLISCLDACPKCTKIIHKEMAGIKEIFGPNLFMFFHSEKSYLDKDKYVYPYTIKYNMKYIKSSFNSKNFNLGMSADGVSQEEQEELVNQKIDRREDIDLTSIPLYYFGILYEIEGKSIKITKL
ncbi:MAG: hypothetical protein K2X28_08020 [Alphaproteobacteria bacterium]|nr:hypothetical protein [Alphaproteobacteria bacterium]